MRSTARGTAAAPQAEEIVARGEELRPWLRAHQALAEHRRGIPPAGIERLDEGGVRGPAAPARSGGSSRRTTGTARRTDGGRAAQGTWPSVTGSAHASHGCLAVFCGDTASSTPERLIRPPARPERTSATHTPEPPRCEPTADRPAAGDSRGTEEPDA
ncbi:hypothetical protein [Streptomyces cinereospinus]|uniref:Uncharacterized protein n=1 Tax=Streptomyces cinereospinus TaxID=285561 RepID=A0ABV5NC35_9ACTN